MSDDTLLVYRLKHTLHSSFDIIYSIVDNLVKLDLNALMLSNILSCIIGLNVETDDDRIGCTREVNVLLVDITNTAVDNTYNYFLITELNKTLLNCFNRTHNVSLNDKVKFLNITGFDL